MEIPITERNSQENLVAGPSTSPRNNLEHLHETKTSLRFFAENQRELLKVIALTSKTQSIRLNVEDTDTETENALPPTTVTPVKTDFT